MCTEKRFWRCIWNSYFIHNTLSVFKLILLLSWCLKHAAAGRMQSINNSSVVHDRRIFVINIFLKLDNLTLATDNASPQRRVAFTLIFQLLSLQNQKRKSRNNPILYSLKYLNKNVSEICGSFVEELHQKNTPATQKIRQNGGGLAKINK